MKNQQQWIMFLKYPYAAAVIACIWIGSTALMLQDHNLPILKIISINLVVSWVIAWISFRAIKLK
jgi:hypothetical protein